MMSFERTTHSTLLVLTLAALTTLPVPAYGQALFGNLYGTVSDSSGAVIAKAIVTIRNSGTGTAMSVTTNESGNYMRTQLAAGIYRVTIQAPGFQTNVFENVSVNLDSSTRVDATLQLGTQSQEITVSETSRGLQGDRAEVSTSLSNREIETLPVFNRNITQLSLLVPGTVGNPHAIQTSGERAQSGIPVLVNGQEASGTNFTIDGTDNNDIVLGIIIVNPNVDSVEEYKVTTSNFDAEFGQAGGAVVQVQTKSGTNGIHGSLFEYLQNNVLQARNSFSQGLHAPGTPAPPQRGVPPLRWNQFGGSLGGPIIRNKLFGFFDYQGMRRRIGGSLLTSVPTAAARSGDLSAYGVDIFDPLSGASDGSGRLRFADPTRGSAANPGGLNIIPKSRLSPQALNLLNFLPLPTLTPSNPAAPNYAATGVQTFNNNQFDIRIDHYLTNSLRLFGRYSSSGYEMLSPPAFGLYGGPNLTGINSNGNYNNRNQNGVLALNANVGATLLTDFRFGAVRYRVRGTNTDYGQRLADQVGIPGINLPDRPDTWVLPRMTVSGTSGFQLGFLASNPVFETENVFQYVNNWTKIRGNHTIKWGADIRRAQNTRTPSENQAGTYTFTAGVTSLFDTSRTPSAVVGGLSLASFILGQPNQFVRTAEFSTDAQDLQTRMFYYAQDTWRATRELTVSYGVRWDTWFPDESRHAGQGSRYDVSDNLARIPGVGGISMSGDAITQWHNISPRVGIAYLLAAKTVVRTGFGRSYYQRGSGVSFNDIADSYPTRIDQNFPAASVFFPVFPLSTAPPLPVQPPIPTNGLLPLPDKVNTAYRAANIHFPYVDSWNMTVERQVSTKTTVSVSYVGNVGRHLFVTRQLNMAVPGPGALNPRRPLFQKFGLTQSIADNSGFSTIQPRIIKGTYHR